MVIVVLVKHRRRKKQQLQTANRWYKLIEKHFHLHILFRTTCAPLPVFFSFISLQCISIDLHEVSICNWWFLFCSYAYLWCVSKFSNTSMGAWAGRWKIRRCVLFSHSGNNLIYFKVANTVRNCSWSHTHIKWNRWTGCEIYKVDILKEKPYSVRDFSFNFGMALIGSLVFTRFHISICC